MVVTGDSLLNGINVGGLSKDQLVEIHNFPGDTSETTLKEINILISDKPNCIIIHSGTSDFTNGTNFFKKIVKKVKQTSPDKKTVFSSLVTRKDKRDLEEKVQDVNRRLKIYRAETNIDHIENNVKNGAQFNNRG